MKDNSQHVDIYEAERQFEEFFSSCGFSLPSGGLKLDGKIHRFSVGDQFWPDGLSHDGRPHGWVQDWHEGGDKRYWQYRAEGCNERNDLISGMSCYVSIANCVLQLRRQHGRVGLVLKQYMRLATLRYTRVLSEALP